MRGALPRLLGPPPRDCPPPACPLCLWRVREVVYFRLIESFFLAKLLVLNVPPVHSRGFGVAFF